MNNKLILASAGAGKTHRIVKESIEQIKNGNTVLIVTYTENNQEEIINKFIDLEGKSRDRFHVKGLYTFLLNDLIRPYQGCIFGGRVRATNFNGNKHPHKIKTKGGKTRWIKGRQEKNENGTYNPLCYLTPDNKKAHTMFLAKLASRVLKESKGKTIERLEGIYSHIYFDEVQDLVGWDYDVLNEISKSNKININCVGDFRQTIYATSTAPKKPKTNKEKIEKFHQMKFSESPMCISRRSIQSICDFADTIHIDEKYNKTESLVEEIPEKFQNHLGVFIVRESEAENYIKVFNNVVLLRASVASGKKYNDIPVTKVNFGKSKGLGFDRVLILPTEDYTKYLMGQTNIFVKKDSKTDESKNKLYVAITRARYSVGFIVKDDDADKCGLPVWGKENY